MQTVYLTTNYSCCTLSVFIACIIYYFSSEVCSKEQKEVGLSRQGSASKSLGAHHRSLRAQQRGLESGALGGGGGGAIWTFQCAALF